MFSDRLQYYFGTSHIIKVYNTDIPFVDLNKYSWNKVIHLAQQQKENWKKKGSSSAYNYAQLQILSIFICTLSISLSSCGHRNNLVCADCNVLVYFKPGYQKITFYLNEQNPWFFQTKLDWFDELVLHYPATMIH